MATKEFFAKIRRWQASEFDARRRAIKAALIDRWLELTGELRSTLPAYQDAMDVREDVHDDSIVFVLRNQPVIAPMVEHGTAPFDMRTTIPRSPRARIARAGHKFVFVPFGRTTRQIRKWGGSVAERMAKSLKPYQGPGSERLPPGLAEKLDPYHAADPLAAVVRKARAAPERGSSYMTWRTISEKGKPWIHPGIRSRHYMNRVLREEAEEIIRRTLGEMK
jgi:hypothetical protein